MAPITIKRGHDDDDDDDGADGDDAEEDQEDQADQEGAGFEDEEGKGDDDDGGDAEDDDDEDEDDIYTHSCRSLHVCTRPPCLCSGTYTHVQSCV